MVICGEDNAASREYFVSLLNKYREKGYLPQNVALDDLKILVGGNSQAPNLFGLKQLYNIENLNKKLGRAKNEELASMLKKIDQNKEFILIDWEDSTPSRDLKIRRLGTIKEFKPSQNVFKLLDACYPANLASFNRILNEVATPRSEVFIYIMLTRHLRSLLLAKEGELSSRLQPWQKQRIIRQTQHWDRSNLLTFYQKLLGIDITLKTGKNVFGIKASIEILSCYYIS